MNARFDTYALTRLHSSAGIATCTVKHPATHDSSTAILADAHFFYFHPFVFTDITKAADFAAIGLYYNLPPFNKTFGYFIPRFKPFVYLKFWVAVPRCSILAITLASLILGVNLADRLGVILTKILKHPRVLNLRAVSTGP